MKYLVLTALPAAFFLASESSLAERASLKRSSFDSSEKILYHKQAPNLKTKLDYYLKPTKSQDYALYSSSWNQAPLPQWDVGLIETSLLEKDHSQYEIGAFGSKGGKVIGIWPSAEKFMTSDIRAEQYEEQVFIPKNIQRLLGFFIAGGPFGIFVAPWIYQLVGGNIILWVMCCLFIGLFSWPIFWFIFYGVISIIARQIQSIKSNLKSKDGPQ